MTEIAEKPQIPISLQEAPAPRSIGQLQIDSARIERALAPDLRFEGVRNAEHQNAMSIINALRSGVVTEEEAATIIANRRTELILGAGEDELTELKSRAGFEQAMTVAVNLDRRHGKSTVFAYMDLDGFKDANDTSGHAVGDQILIGVGGLILEELLRSSDVGARIGGDEYVIGLPSSNLKTANEKALRIVKAIPSTASEIAEEMGKPLKEDVTGSVGVVEVKHSPTDKRSSFEIVQDMLSQADAAMYAAKLLGKNTVVNVLDRGNGEFHILDVKRGIIYEPIRGEDGKIAKLEVANG